MVGGSLDELAGRFTDFIELQRGTPTVALAAVPLQVGGGRPLGGYMLFFDEAQTFDDRHRQELGALGRELAAALRRAQRGEARPAVMDRPGDPVDGLAADYEVTPEPAAVAGARRFLRRTLHDWDVDEETADTGVLCLSELVTNAVIHSHAGCLVRVRLEAGALTTTVRDGGTGDAASIQRLEDPLRVHGRGLQVVEALATRWGYELHSDSTTVWFELEV